MFDDVPVRVWLVLAIGAVAYAPAVYVYRHMISDPRRRELFAPPEDLSWRSRRQFITSASILAALVALAIFIFTPAAERFARSPSFMPLLLLGFGSFSLFTVAQSMVTGTIEPLARGFTRTYERSGQPKRFWASAVWNSFMGGVCLWGAVATISSQTRDRCYDYGDTLTQREQLAACSDMLAEPDLSREERGSAYRIRGVVRHELGDHEKAIDDYNRAIDLDPNDSYALYNRGLLYLKGEQFRFAIEDFSRSLRLRPDNKDGHVFRADAYAASGNLRKAIADNTKVLEFAPDEEAALVRRGTLYVWTDDLVRAKQDFDQVRASYPSSILLVRAEAVLSLHTKDLPTADLKLREALAREPDDRWTLEVLAEVQDRLGQRAEAEATRRKLTALEHK